MNTEVPDEHDMYRIAVLVSRGWYHAGLTDAWYKRGHEEEHGPHGLSLWSAWRVEGEE